MRVPKTKFGSFIIKYKQIRYDNRYFFVYFNNVEIMKVPINLFDMLENMLSCQFDTSSKQWKNFKDKIKEYDKKMDEWI